MAVFSGLGIGPVFSEWLLDDVNFERTFIAAGSFAISCPLPSPCSPRRESSRPTMDGVAVDSTRAAARRR